MQAPSKNSPPTASVAGEAKAVESQTTRTLLEIEDEIDDVRLLIDAASMAAADLPNEQAGR